MTHNQGVAGSCPAGPTEQKTDYQHIKSDLQVAFLFSKLSSGWKVDGKGLNMLCGKIIYADRSSAIKSIKGIHNDRRGFKSKKRPVQSYYCFNCGGYHITSNKRRLGNYIPTTKVIFTKIMRNTEKRLLILNFT